jgi:cytidylate kinase
MTRDQPQHPPVVTIASLYGGGGTIIAPRVAERLGVAYLDRAIPDAVAKETGLSEEAVADIDEQPRSGMERLAATLGRASSMMGAAGGSEERLDLQERQLRGEIEEFMAQASRSGGVVLGRGGAVVLATIPWALHVLLRGPRATRIARTMELEQVDRKTAEQRVEVNDRARIGYVRRAYGVDGQDPSLYHLMIEATAFDHAACVGLIVQASQARSRQPTSTLPP